MTTKPVAQHHRRSTGLLVIVAIAGLLALSPAPSVAVRDNWDHDWNDDWSDDLLLLQMQREAIATQEEQAREAGREKRRDEVEQLQEKQANEREEYFQSVLEASQASLRAPRGAYYRKPGETTQEAPAAAQPIEVEGVSYLYDQGVFWLTPGPPFTAVVAPYGAVVDKLPAGAYRLPGKEGQRYYSFGVFFQDKAGKFEVVKPAAGTLVMYLPDGYRTEQAQGKTHFTFGATRFVPVFVQGVLVYQVIEP